MTYISNELNKKPNWITMISELFDETLKAMKHHSKSSTIQ
jgi:hypothetical protein